MSELNLPTMIDLTDLGVVLTALSDARNMKAHYEGIAIVQTKDNKKLHKELDEARDEVESIHKDFDTLGVPKSTLHGRLNLLVGSYEAERAELKAELERRGEG